MSDRGLAKMLKEYDVSSKVVRIDGETKRGYARADLIDAWARYLPVSARKCVTSVTGVTTDDGRIRGSDEGEF